MIYRVEYLFMSKNTPTTYLPVSRAFDTLSTRVIMAWLVECFFPKCKLIFIEHIIIFKEVNNIRGHNFFKYF